MLRSSVEQVSLTAVFSGRERTTIPPPIAIADDYGCAALGSAAFVASHAGVFERIFADGVSVCVWERPVDAILEPYLLQNLSRNRGWEIRARVDTQAARLDELLSVFENGIGRVRLQTELTGLIELFTTLTDARAVGIRLTATQRATCPRFHTDQVGLRLLCTWIGAGTEWLAEEDVMRSPPEPGGYPPEGPVRPGAQVQQLGRFAVGVFKGETWPGNEGRGAVHRSPQPQGWRLFVSLDAL
jgi:Protein of unknown function (DUF1826)